MTSLRLKPSTVRRRGAGFKSEYHLSFVDLGLLPLIVAQVGSSLESLIESNVAVLKADLQLADVSPETGHWLLQTIFGSSPVRFCAISRSLGSPTSM